MQDTKAMRVHYLDALRELMKENDKIIVLEADLGRSLNTTTLLNDEFPGRVIDVGIAEQNMIAMASGLAIGGGYIPFAHSFVPFVMRRTFDQLAVSVAFADANVKVIGTDPGILAEINGATHMSFEDLGAMRALYNFQIFEPADGKQLSEIVKYAANTPGPMYIRTARSPMLDVLYGDDYVFTAGKADVLKQGNDVTLIACGIMVGQASQAAQLLAEEGISARVLNMHTIKPLDCEAVVAAAKETGAIVTAENHSIYGGLGGAVAECAAENYPVVVKRVGIPQRPGEVGRLPYLMEIMGLTAKDIVAAAKSAIAAKK